MRILTLPHGDGPGSSLVLLLLILLILSGVLAYQAQDAARSHRAASESALRDYAALASDELSRQLRRDVENLAEEVLDASADAERRRSPAARLEEFAKEMQEQLGFCDCPEVLHDYFALDLRSNSIHVRDPSRPAEVGGWIADTVQRHAAVLEARRLSGRISPDLDRRRELRGRGRELDGLAQVELAGDRTSSLLYALIRDDDGDAVRAYGVVIDRAEFVAATARAIMAEVALLPPSLTGDLGADRMLSVALTSDGNRLFHSGGVADVTTEVTDTLETALGTYLLQVAVLPEMAGSLVIGGLPRSRLPLLLGIFLLTLGLSAIAIIQLRKQQALVRLRSGFVASVSHELRTPLAQIRLFADLLGSGRLAHEQSARAVRIIGEEAQRLAYLVENVLRFSRSHQRSDQLMKLPVDLAVLVGAIVEGFAPLAHTRQARIEPLLETGTVAEVDQDAVRQVLLNLLDNSVKYGPSGQTIRVGVAREGVRVRLWVDDQGPGIPAADRALIWEAYHRLRRDVEVASGGSGIGLAVVRDLVAMHGGTVAAEAAPDGGARFVVWFPAQPRRPTDRSGRRAGETEALR